MEATGQLYTVVPAASGCRTTGELSRVPVAEPEEVPGFVFTCDAGSDLPVSCNADDSVGGICGASTGSEAESGNRYQREKSYSLHKITCQFSGVRINCRQFPDVS